MITIPFWLFMCLCFVSVLASYKVGHLRARQQIANFFGGLCFRPSGNLGVLMLQFSSGDQIELNLENPRQNALAVEQFIRDGYVGACKHKELK